MDFVPSSSYSSLAENPAGPQISQLITSHFNLEMLMTAGAYESLLERNLVDYFVLTSDVVIKTLCEIWLLSARGSLSLGYLFELGQE